MNQRIVSLGSNCMVAQEMRKFFGIEAANLFDWWITPGDALVRLLESDFDGLFSRENLRIVGDGRSVANIRYGILHHHDFPKNRNSRVEAITEDAIQGNLNKFAYLKKRWDDLAHSQGPVLFLRYNWNSVKEPLLMGVPPEPIDADPARVIAALDRKFPQLDYRVLFIDAPEATLEHPKVVLRSSYHFTRPGECLDAADLAWKDNTPIFSRVFSSVPLR